MLRFHGNYAVIHMIIASEIFKIFLSAFLLEECIINRLSLPGIF